ncbi:hypothetical protein GCM10029992_66710 [Glycomyces albus]
MQRPRPARRFPQGRGREEAARGEWEAAARGYAKYGMSIEAGTVRDKLDRLDARDGR